MKGGLEDSILRLNSKRLIGFLFACLALWASYSFAEQTDVASATPVTVATTRVAVADTADNTTIAEKTLPATTPGSGKPSDVANPETVKPEATKVGSGSHLANVALGLVFIVILILALGWFMRRFNQGGLFNNSAIKIVAVTPLGTRERLLVIDVSGQQILLGVTAAQINTLHVFTEPVVDASNPPATSEFGRKMLAALQQKTFHQTAFQQKTREKGTHQDE